MTERSRGPLRQLLHDAAGDLADEVRFAIVIVGCLGAGAAIGYLVGGGGGVVPGLVAGAAVLAVGLLVVAVRWVAEIAGRLRGRSR